MVEGTNGVEVVCEVEVGPRALTIDYFDLAYGIFEYEIDCLRPHTSHELFTPLGDVEVLVNGERLELSSFSRRTFRCTLAHPPALHDSRQWQDGHGSSSGLSSGLRIFLDGSKKLAILISPEGENIKMWRGALKRAVAYPRSTAS